jgi:hypothetical protein
MALNGETVSADGGSKLAQAVRRHALLVPADSIVESNADLIAELEAKWLAPVDQV